MVHAVKSKIFSFLRVSNQTKTEVKTGNTKTIEINNKTIISPSDTLLKSNILHT